MSIKIIRPGLLTTLQDLGRYGFQRYGVIISGAMDQFSLRIANLLLGNKENSACLEITMMGPSLLIKKDTLISICGGNLSPKIGGYPVPQWRSVYVKEGSILEFGACVSGCRAYLSVAGGFNIQEVMGSKSTYLRAEIGGFQGRSLKENDVLEFSEPSDEGINIIKKLSSMSESNYFAAPKWFVSTEILPKYSSNPIIRIIHGGEFEKFSAKSRELFFTSEFQVTSQSDRMGYRLKGSTLELSQPLEMISEAVSFGTIQVPPDGNPIVLLADRQTTGGYPKIAQVASVDLPIIAQIKPGERIRFKEISIEEAQILYIQRELDIKKLKVGLTLSRL
ncbi:KipI antagonist [Clostridium polyendosporum]|uniref:KipI antagonist n=1 Tax=Clostridium polyendosporum TaxID=69208 RepID=A0A919VFZ0_9CLOT|nr:biotin-dependent carboxyltransferase family protein [Clostridium polyendosporum]GIM28036.1 KipI antagonist [Clostridium polyendosporum]